MYFRVLADTIYHWLKEHPDNLEWLKTPLTDAAAPLINLEQQAYPPLQVSAPPLQSCYNKICHSGSACQTSIVSGLATTSLPKTRKLHKIGFHKVSLHKTHIY